MHLDSSNVLHLAGASAIECPHCRAHAQMTVTAAPDFDALSRMQPESAGIVMHCESCHSPVFRQHRISRIGRRRIEFETEGQDVERRDDQLRTEYLPAAVGAYYNDAVGCYRAGLMQAFASMCRMTVQAMIAASGERSDSMQLQLYDQFDEIASVARMNDGVMLTAQDVLFDTTPETIYSASLDRAGAAIILEIIKDLLHQTYIRHGRLNKVLGMRRFFAARHSETDNHSKPFAGLRSNRRRPTGTDGN